MPPLRFVDARATRTCPGRAMPQSCCLFSAIDILMFSRYFLRFMPATLLAADMIWRRFRHAAERCAAICLRRAHAYAVEGLRYAIRVTLFRLFFHARRHAATPLSFIAATCRYAAFIISLQRHLSAIDIAAAFFFFADTVFSRA